MVVYVDLHEETQTKQEGVRAELGENNEQVR